MIPLFLAREIVNQVASHACEARQFKKGDFLDEQGEVLSCGWIKPNGMS